MSFLGILHTISEGVLLLVDKDFAQDMVNYVSSEWQSEYHHLLLTY